MSTVILNVQGSCAEQGYLYQDQTNAHPKSLYQEDNITLLGDRFKTMAEVQVGKGTHQPLMGMTNLG